MTARERSQNPVIGNDVKLRFNIWNGNQRTDVLSVTNVEIYFLDPTLATEELPDGRRLVKTIDTADVVREALGEYSVTFALEDEVFTIGKYLDIWTVVVEEDEPAVSVAQRWKILPNLYYTSPEPFIYDFVFGFRPNRIRAGSKRYLIVETRPNVPTASDLEQYYLNLAVSADILVSIEKACGDCLPPEQDLRLVVDKELVELRKNCEGYFFLDTEALELDCGIYNIWFEMEFGESKFISEMQQLEIFS